MRFSIQKNRAIVSFVHNDLLFNNAFGLHHDLDSFPLLCDFFELPITGMFSCLCFSWLLNKFVIPWIGFMDEIQHIDFCGSCFKIRIRASLIGYKFL